MKINCTSVAENTAEKSLRSVLDFDNVNFSTKIDTILKKCKSYLVISNIMETSWTKHIATSLLKLVQTMYWQLVLTMALERTKCHLNWLKGFVESLLIL